MEISTLIAAAIAALFLFEVWALLTGRLQREVGKSKLSSLVVVVMSVTVLVTLQDKILGAGGNRYVVYGVLLVFNAALFGGLLIRSLMNKGSPTESQYELRDRT